MGFLAEVDLQIYKIQGRVSVIGIVQPSPLEASCSPSKAIEAGGCEVAWRPTNQQIGGARWLGVLRKECHAGTQQERIRKHLLSLVFADVPSLFFFAVV